MFFTKDDLKKIENYLRDRGVKDTDFPEVSYINPYDLVSIVQNSKNVKVRLDNLGNIFSQFSPFKGYFLNESILYNKYKNPKDGWSAWVGTPFPGTVYIVENGKWKDTGNPPDINCINVDLDDYVTKEELNLILSGIYERLDYIEEILKELIGDNKNKVINQVLYLKNGISNIIGNALYFTKDATYNNDTLILN